MDVENDTISLLPIHFPDSIPMSNFSAIAVSCYSIATRSNLVSDLGGQNSPNRTILVQDL